jgi:hypothetical protein
MLILFIYFILKSNILPNIASKFSGFCEGDCENVFIYD